MKSEKKLTCEEAKNLDMVHYLSTLGFEPSRTRNVNYWYLSPLRNERTPSFKVNRRLNRWYDFGIGRGGNLIDFGILYHQCTVTELLQILSGDLSFQKQMYRPEEQAVPTSKIIIEQDIPITAPALLQYLESRRIDIEVACRYCREIHYQVNDKKYFAIGFKNNSGGYELRSPYFKGSTAPKDITTIDNGHHIVQVFEGFFDFLSIQTYYKHWKRDDVTFVILNSIAFFEKARPFMEQRHRILLSLDNDPAGQNCSYCAVRSPYSRYEDYSYLYHGYKDINMWLVAEGYKSQFNGENNSV